uniref:Protein FAR1-RELATED SEQUENCE n=1 Tax=Aegilops tauschii subsp. strangulata TaxID=200361 RepID=A0A453QVV9_AEGTS
MPKASHEFACRRAGGKFNVGYTLTDQKNHLRTKRQREMAYGQAGSMLKFFRDKIAENPSFQYYFQFDCEEHIANIFWVDANMYLTMHTLVMLSLLTLHLARTKSIGHLVFFLGSISLEKQTFLVLH